MEQKIVILPDVLCDTQMLHETFGIGWMIKQVFVVPGSQPNHFTTYALLERETRQS
ncbi:MAG: hypothetical protein Q4A61_03490 [Porphyromonadaceae bacterium]|nr:hypothetical protein [Porphyromonadaceae bacterium]